MYDEKANFIGDTHWREDYDLDEGAEVELDRRGILVEVADCVERRNQDVADILGKRAKEVEERRAARSANPASSPPRVTAQPRADATPSVPQNLRSKPLHELLGTPSGHYGKAVVPITSPYEQRQAATSPVTQPPPKRRRLSPPPARIGYASNLTGATLSLMSQPRSSVPLRLEPVSRITKLHQNVEGVDLTREEPEALGAFADVRVSAHVSRSKPDQRRNRHVSPPGGYARNLTGATLTLVAGSQRKARGQEVKVMRRSRPADYSGFVDIDSTQEDAMSLPPQAVQIPQAVDAQSRKRKTNRPMRSETPVDGFEMQRKAEKPRSVEAGTGDEATAAPSTTMPKRHQNRPKQHDAIHAPANSNVHRNNSGTSSRTLISEHVQPYSNDGMSAIASERTDSSTTKLGVNSKKQNRTLLCTTSSKPSEVVPADTTEIQADISKTADEQVSVAHKSAKPLRIKSQTRKPGLLMSRSTSSSSKTRLLNKATKSFESTIDSPGTPPLSQASRRLEDYAQMQENLVRSRIARSQTSQLTFAVSEAAGAEEPRTTSEDSVEAADDIPSTHAAVQSEGRPGASRHSARPEVLAEVRRDSVAREVVADVPNMVAAQLSASVTVETAGLGIGGGSHIKDETPSSKPAVSVCPNVQHESIATIEEKLRTMDEPLALSAVEEKSVPADPSAPTPNLATDSLSERQNMREAAEVQEILANFLSSASPKQSGAELLNDIPAFIAQASEPKPTAQTAPAVPSDVHEVSAQEELNVSRADTNIQAQSMTVPRAPLSNPATRGRKAATRIDQSLVLGTFSVPDLPTTLPSFVRPALRPSMGNHQRPPNISVSIVAKSVQSASTTIQNAGSVSNARTNVVGGNYNCDAVDGPWSREASDLFDWRPKLTEGVVTST